MLAGQHTQYAHHTRIKSNASAHSHASISRCLRPLAGQHAQHAQHTTYNKSNAAHTHMLQSPDASGRTACPATLAARAAPGSP
jgi:hypothetical protein